MVDVMHYKVMKREEITGEHLIAYLLESDGGRWFSAVRSPDDIELNAGDTLKHFVSDQWKTQTGDIIIISPDLKCSTFEEADEKFQSFFTV